MLSRYSKISFIFRIRELFACDISLDDIILTNCEKLCDKIESQVPNLKSCLQSGFYKIKQT